MDMTAANDPNNVYGTKFLNPANDEVQQFILQLLGDLAKYDIDGIFLDRCRYNDFASDFLLFPSRSLKNILVRRSKISPMTSLSPEVAIIRYLLRNPST